MTQSAGNEESCYWVIDHLQEFLHGEMSEHDADAFRRHIAACEKCTSRIAGKPELGVSP